MKTALIIFACALFLRSQSQAFINPSLENWGSPSTCDINTVPTGWIGFSNACAEVDEANLAICPSTIPPSAAQGNTYARACCGGWGQGEGIAQKITGLITGQTYTV